MGHGGEDGLGDHLRVGHHDHGALRLHPLRLLLLNFPAAVVGGAVGGGVAVGVGADGRGRALEERRDCKEDGVERSFKENH